MLLHLIYNETPPDPAMPQSYYAEITTFYPSRPRMKLILVNCSQLCWFTPKKHVFEANPAPTFNNVIYLRISDGGAVLYEWDIKTEAD